MELSDVLKTALQLLEQLKSLVKAAEDRLVIVAQREKNVELDEVAVEVREAKVLELEESLGAQFEIKKAKDQLHDERIAFEKEKAGFQNEMVALRQDIQNRQAQLEEIKQEADQVRADKAQLVIDRANYKDQVIKEIQDNLKMGKM